MRRVRDTAIPGLKVPFCIAHGVKDVAIPKVGTEWLLEQGLSAPELFATDAGPRIILHPGTSAFAAFKRWPTAKFAGLARGLLDAGHRVAVSFGPGEEGLAAEVEAGAPGVIPVDGKKAQYVRLYSKGNTANEMNHYVEVEVFGKE